MGVASRLGGVPGQQITDSSVRAARRCIHLCCARASTTVPADPTPLPTVQAKIVAMTCTHAALKRK